MLMRPDITAAVKKIFEKMKKLGLAVDGFTDFLEKIEYFEWQTDTTDSDDKPKQGAAKTYQKKYRYYRTIFMTGIVKVILAGKFASCGPLSKEEAIAIHEFLHAWIDHKGYKGDDDDGDAMVNGLELVVHDYIDFLQATVAADAAAVATADSALSDHLLDLAKVPGDSFDVLKAMGIVFKLECTKTKTFNGRFKLEVKSDTGWPTTTDAQSQEERNLDDTIVPNLAKLFDCSDGKCPKLTHKITVSVTGQRGQKVVNNVYYIEFSGTFSIVFHCTA
jgi:hypothetical protein